MRVVVFTSATLLTIVLGFGARAQRGQPDDVVFHDMATIAKAPYGPYSEARAVLTETCSIAIATPVLRREWLPPHPQVPPQPQAPQAQRIPANAAVTLDFDTASGGWAVVSTGARRKTLTGQTIRATFWDLSRGGASVDIAINRTSREQLVFVLNGHATAETAELRRTVGPEMLIEVRPAARNIVLRSQQYEPSMIVVFDTSSR